MRSNSGGAQAVTVRFELDPDGLSIPHTLFLRDVAGVLSPGSSSD